MVEGVVFANLQRLARPGQVVLGGVLGEALDANLHGRLSHFITGPESPAIRIFDAANREHNEEGDWYGEHAGKWLSAAARAAARSGDETLRSRVLAVADHLVSLQEADGYLGNYAPGRRFMVPQPSKPESWNGEPALRTWDVWTHSYLILGLAEVYRCFGHVRHLDAARGIGDLCWHTFCGQGIDITSVGNHHGMSATVLIDPAVDLHELTGDARYLELAECVLAQADANPRLALLQRALAGVDPSEISTGKAYQLCWNLVGLAKLHRATGKEEYARALSLQWQAIREHHIGLGGGPSGGVGQRSREVFNPPFVFDPAAYIETCSILAWIQLNRELLAITGDPRHAEEIERVAYNDLLGAQAPNGEDWCYYSFQNGRRIHTNYWRCCKSSGAMAMEELPAIAYAIDAQGVVVNLLGPGHARLSLADGSMVGIRQDTRYPFDGSITLSVSPAVAMAFRVRIRIPEWAEGAMLRTPDGAVVACEAGRYMHVERTWSPGDALVLELPMRARVHRRANRNVQESRAPDGSPVRQQVLEYRYIAFKRGPLVYATGLVDGYRTSETVRLPDDDAAIVLEESSCGDDGAVGLRLHAEGRAAIDFSPYHALGARQDRTWRLTWLGLAPSPDGIGECDCGEM